MNRLYSLYNIRIRFVYFLSFVCSTAILGKMFYIQTIQSEDYRQKTHAAGIIERPIKGFRGTIYDRNNQILAETIKTYTFWTNTNKEVDKERIIDLFSRVFNRSIEDYQKLLALNKNYIMLAQGKFESQCESILYELKDIKGLHCDVNISRYYPFRNLASQVVGYVDKNYKGQFGIERQFDPVLQGKTSSLVYNRSASGRLREAIVNQNPDAKDGADIQLTLDVNIQTILLDALNKGLKNSGAKNANGIILNPFTGDILAMASVPDFDPNEYWNYDVATFSNRTISDAYEPGSTYKIITMTAALELDVFQPTDLFYCENGEYQIIDSKTIHDHEPHENLSLSEIFIYSSNIGLSKVADQLGSRHIYDYSRKFGFGIQSGIPLPSETPGTLREYSEWTRLSGPSVSMGQEISINTLQLALAYSAVANRGYLPKAHMIKKITGSDHEERNYSPQPIRRVMSKETSEILLEMMESVVNEGTATKARIPGFRIGGKTGTAEKFVNGAYSKHEFISSFAAVFPIDAPKYVCVVSVDSPDYKRGKHWGNETAAPIVKDIFERLIINNKEFIPVELETEPQIVHNEYLDIQFPMLAGSGTIQKSEPTVPDFRGLTLKQSMQKAKYLGLIILPVGTSGRVVWQSISPGQLVNHTPKCTIKLEAM